MGWAHGQANPEGWQEFPQVQGEAQLLAEGARFVHEPRRAPTRRRQSPARWASHDDVAIRLPGPQGRHDCCTPHGYSSWRQEEEVDRSSYMDRCGTKQTFRIS